MKNQRALKYKDLSKSNNVKYGFDTFRDLFSSSQCDTKLMREVLETYSKNGERNFSEEYCRDFHSYVRKFSNNLFFRLFSSSQCDTKLMREVLETHSKNGNRNLTDEYCREFYDYIKDFVSGGSSQESLENTSINNASNYD